MRKPNCIIIGCQKCGTTALKKYIAQHPDIFMLENEVHYFDQKKALPISWYCSLFANRKEKIVGEKSPAYCYFQEIPPQIAELNPACKIIICVRDPVARAYSEYQMLKLNGVTKGRWEEVWNTRHYLARGLYAEQLKNVYKYFNKNQVLIIKTEELYSNRLAVVKATFNFLGVNDTFIPEQLGDVHKGGHGKYIIINLITKYCIKCRQITRKSRYTLWLDDALYHVVNILKFVNKKKGYKPMSDEMKQKLREYYKEPNEEFYKMTGIRWE